MTVETLDDDATTFALDLGAWVEEGVCASVDPEVWFPPQGGNHADAKRVCGRCPVAQECLDYALATDEEYGVWGGASRLDRERMAAGAIPPVPPPWRKEDKAHEADVPGIDPSKPRPLNLSDIIADSLEACA